MNSKTGKAQSGSTLEKYEKKVPWIAHSIVTLIILVFAVLVVSGLFSAKPTANRWGDKPAASVAVEVSPLELESFDVWVDSYGTAQALTETRLVAEISGRVIEVSTKIRAGGTFSKGDVLAKLDSRDFKVELDIAISQAADIEVQYVQELAQAELAAKEWNKPPESPAARKLALREPQLAAAKASLQAAKSRVERARLNLQRTEIIAPFDGKILEQFVDIGDFVTPSQNIASIYSLDVVEVRLPIKVHDLEHLILPEGDTQDIVLPSVLFESEMGNKTYQWRGKIVRTEGAFDPSTRMLYVVAQIEKPFITSQQRPAVRIGQFMRAKIEGKQYKQVFVIPRRAVSQDFVVSIVDNGLLKKKKIVPLWTDTQVVVVSSQQSDEVLKVNYQGNSKTKPVDSLNNSDTLILTPTANLPDGTKVKPLNDSDSRKQPEIKKPLVAKSSSNSEQIDSAVSASNIVSVTAKAQ
jgi:RND family efflux transporter MFP subunit